MSKSAKKRPMASAPAAVPITKSSRHRAGDPEPKRADRGSKQSRVIWPGPFSGVKRPSICPNVFGLNYLIGMA